VTQTGSRQRVESSYSQCGIGKGSMNGGQRVGASLFVAALVWVLGPACAVSADTPKPLEVPISQGCTKPGQHCMPRFTVDLVTGDSPQMQYLVPGHCSSIRLHIYFDGEQVQTTTFLGWPGAGGAFSSLPLKTDVIALGPVGPGRHTLALEAEGKIGGCNAGQLSHWEGKLLLFDVSQVAVASGDAASIDNTPPGTPRSELTQGDRTSLKGLGVAMLIVAGALGFASILLGLMGLVFLCALLGALAFVFLGLGTVMATYF
jgi:hypothetical protein